MQEKSKKRILVKIMGLILIFSILGFAFPMIAKAENPLTAVLAAALGSIGKDILLSLMYTWHTVLNWLLKASAIILEGTLDIGFNPKIVRVAQIGWTTTRDFANMFFILFMIIIAFATILRTEQYGAKKLLPKVILIALLINFSFVICSVIIDFSNIAAKFFIEGIKNNLSGQKEGIITATFSDSLNMTGAFTTYTNCEDYRDKETRKCNELNGKLIASAILRTMPSNLDCIAWVGALYEKCKEQGSITIQSDDKNFLSIILALTVGSLVMLIAAFTFLAGAIMLLIRIVALWLLVVIVPLAFICHIMPGLSSQWRKWWDTFLKWCFFAPIYTFFIWMAIQIAVNGANQAIGVSARKIPGDMSGPITNPFVADPGAQFISYGIMIAFLLGGLIVAQKLGIAGANTAMAIAQKAKKGATDWAKRTSMRPVKSVGTMAGAGALTAGGKLFGGKIGGRMQAKATQMKRARTQTKENKAYEKLTDTMTDEQLSNEVKTALGARKLIATQKAQARGLLQKTKDRDAVRTGISTLRGYGFEKEAGDLEETRFSAIKDKTKRKEIARKVKAKNVHKELKPIVFEGPEGYEAAADFASLEPTVSAAIETAKQMRIDTQKTYARGLLAKFINNNDFTDKENIKLRSIYAALTGELHHAFRDGKTGKVDKTALGSFVKNMKPNNYADIDKNSIKHIAEFVDGSAAFEAGRFISAETKKMFINEWENIVAAGIASPTGPPTPAAIKAQNTLDHLKQKSPGWAALIT